VATALLVAGSIYSDLLDSLQTRFCIRLLVLKRRPKRRQNVITALTTLPQGWVSTSKHQCTTAITTMWKESSWTFLRATLPDRALERWGRQKGS